MMDETKARSLVKRLVHAAWGEGRYSTNPNSLILKDSQKKVEVIGDEIIRRLTNCDND